MLKTIVCIIAFAFLAGCSSTNSKIKSSEAPKKYAPAKNFKIASEDFKLCKKNSINKNIPSSDNAGSIQEAVVTECKKQFSDYWMATMLKYKIQADLQSFEQAYRENLSQEIAQKLAQKNLSVDSTSSSKPQP